MSPKFRLRSLAASGMAFAAAGVLASPAIAQSGPYVDLDDAGKDTVVITGERPVQQRNPTTVATLTAEEIATTTTVTNAEDALRYLPNIVVRKRHIGDTFAPITTRTSGVGASARSLIYVDGAIISALIGNNGNGSPKWGMVSAEEISSVDVSYRAVLGGLRG